MTFRALTLAAAILFFGVVAASSASAYVGESLVQSAGTLTKGAETYLEQGGSVSEIVTEAGSYGGAEEAGSAAAVFEGAGVLPVLGGSVLAFGAGFGIGTEICHVLGISGCWNFSSTAKTSYGTGSWQFFESAQVTELATLPAYQWRFYPGCGVQCAYKSYGGFPSNCGSSAPVAPGTFVATVGPASCSAESKEYSGNKGTFTRSAMQDRVLTYDATDNPEISNYSYSAPSGWSKNMASQLKGASSSTPAGRVGQHIASQIEGSTVHDPYDTEVEIPASCETGVKAGVCLTELEELELVPKVTEVDWDQAVIEELDTLDPEETREEESEKIIEIAPVPGTTVETGSEVTVDINPDTEHMPEFLPEPDKTGGEDGEGEDVDEYKKRLAPIFIPNVGTLSDSTLDPEVGPNGVSHTVPGPYHRFDPSTEHEVDVEVNPADAPLVGGGAQGSCEATVGAIDWTPLNQPLGSRFPFGVFAFFVAWAGEWAASMEPPEWEVTVLPPMLGGEGLTITIPLEAIAPVAEVARIAFLFLSFVGLLWFLGTAAMKIQGDSS